MPTTITCPGCRAKQDAAPVCRRCKADLALVAAVAEQAAAERSKGVASLKAGDGAAALQAFARVRGLDATQDDAKLWALAHLLNRDYSAALSWYSAACPAGR